MGKGYASLAEECAGGEGREGLSWEGPSFVIMMMVLPPAVWVEVCGDEAGGLRLKVPWWHLHGLKAGIAEWAALGQDGGGVLLAGASGHTCTLDQFWGGKEARKYTCR